MTMISERFEKQVKNEFSEMGLEPSQKQLQQLYTYYEMLIEKNKVMNLTAITEEQEVVTKHFSDSLSLKKAFEEKPDFASAEGGERRAFLEQPGLRVMDVGTGAGFPGIPLKIMYPQMQITLLDSLKKRISFLEEVCQTLGLTGVDFIHGRAEDLGRIPERREQYDLCVSRAVANLAVLSEYAMPFVKVGGFFVPYKSGEIEAELEQGKRAIQILGGRVEQVFAFSLPDSNMSRSLIRIRKNHPISKKYPRKAGMPSKEPLC